MKISIVNKIIIMCGILIAVSCSQDPIFYTISNETAPVPPRIDGAPTSMVVFEREYVVGDETISVPILYVASGRLHWYAKIGMGTGVSEWDADEYFIPSPEGKIIALAATRGYLYALSIDFMSVETTLYYIGHSGNEWKTVEASDYPVIQSIYADPDTDVLFAGATRRSSTQHAILYLDDNSSKQELKSLSGIDVTTMLSGAAFRSGTYYFSTRGNGMFHAAGTQESLTSASASVLADTSTSGSQNDNRIFMGMIKLKDAAETIIAVERGGGTLYEVQSGGFERMFYTRTDSSGTIATGYYATGALAVWQDADSEPQTRLLIAGVQGGLVNTSSSSYTHGYVEFRLQADGSFDTSQARRSSGNLLSVRNNNDQYKTSIGKHPINHLFQTPSDIDEEMIFFASTQKKGLWSFRDRNNSNGKWEWNAEE